MTRYLLALLLLVGCTAAPAARSGPWLLGAEYAAGPSPGAAIRQAFGAPVRARGGDEGDVLTLVSGQWVAQAPASGSGDIEGVTAGTGLTGGGTSGTVTLNASVAGWESVTKGTVADVSTDDLVSLGGAQYTFPDGVRTPIIYLSSIEGDAEEKTIRFSAWNQGGFEWLRVRNGAGADLVGVLAYQFTGETIQCGLAGGGPYLEEDSGHAMRLTTGGGGFFIRSAGSAFVAPSGGAFRFATTSAPTTIDATGVSWQQGSGSPEGAVTAPVGSLYSRTDGGAGTAFYVKESGSGNVGWVGK
jgi:hypothetical protein